MLVWSVNLGKVDKNIQRGKDSPSINGVVGKTGQLHVK